VALNLKYFLLFSDINDVISTFVVVSSQDMVRLELYHIIDRLVHHEREGLEHLDMQSPVLVFLELSGSDACVLDTKGKEAFSFQFDDFNHCFSLFDHRLPMLFQLVNP
jgi:hypothetical protein